MSAPEILWTPSPERVQRATLTRYTRWLAEQRSLDLDLDDYEALWRWSVTDLEGFWSSICDFLKIRFDAPAQRILARREMPGAQWFEGARVSYAWHLFRDRDDDEVVIRHGSELRELGSWTRGELRARAGAIQAGLRAHGVGPGDRVVAYMPNIPETIAAFIACAGLGAIWSSCSPDFGVRSVVDRFAQIEPVVLLAVDGYRYGGRDFDRLDVVAQLQAQIPSLRATVVLGYLDDAPDLSKLTAGTIAWGELEHSGAGASMEFASLPFDHPLWVLYSSGTTGLPKPIVHSQGGILVEHSKKHHLHVDAQPGDRVFWYSTTGWMMWNFLVGVLLTDASIVLYDGNPGVPDLGVLWDLAERTGITCFGTSASFISSCMKGGIEPAAGRSLSALESLGSTGSPLSPEGFQWVYDQLGADTWLFSTSGGTDVCTAFVGGVPTLPVYRGELQGRALGAAVESWDEHGSALIDEVGELVITEPMPSMPIYFWGDQDPETGDPIGPRYRDSYFDMYPGVWRHGDWITITARGTAVISGRSDSTINRGGVRMGTSEIYRAVLSLDEVVDALVVDLPKPSTDGFMELFVVLREGSLLDDELVGEIKRRIREDCSPRHVPNEVRAVAEVPRTLSGKLLEVPVKRILMGVAPEQAASRESLANPAALDAFVALAGRDALSG